MLNNSKTYPIRIIITRYLNEFIQLGHCSSDFMKQRLKCDALRASQSGGHWSYFNFIRLVGAIRMFLERGKRWQ